MNRPNWCHYPWIVLLFPVHLSMTTLVGCGAEPGLPLGATCTSNEVCESGLCVDGVCVDPSFGGDAETDVEVSSTDADVTSPDLPDLPEVSDATAPGDTSENTETTPDTAAGEETLAPADTAGGDLEVVPELPPTTVVTVQPAAVINDERTRFEFVSDPPGATFECVFNEGERAPCTSPLELVATEGWHTLLVIATSPDGNEDPSPPTFTWRVDLTPPVTRFDAVPPELDNSTDVELEFSAAERSTFSCRLDGGAWSACTSPWAIRRLPDGDHLAEVQATDEAGNVEFVPATYAWSIDTSTPDTRIDSGPQGAVASTSARFVFSSDAIGVASFTCALDLALHSPCTSPLDLSDLAQGPHMFTVRATSAAGVPDPTPAVRSWVVDTVAPKVSITGGPLVTITDRSPSFSFVVSGDPDLIECRFDDGPFETCTSPYRANRLEDGPHTFEVLVTDAAGHEDRGTRAFSVDTRPPSIVITGGPTGLTRFNPPNFSFIAGADAVTRRCRIDAAPFVNCNSPFSPVSLVDGFHVFEIEVADALGNTDSATRSFTLDATPPSVTITSGPAEGALLANASSVRYTFTASGADTVQCRLYASGQPIPAFASCSSPFTQDINAGAYTFVIRAVDAAGNVRTITRTFTNATVG